MPDAMNPSGTGAYIMLAGPLVDLGLQVSKWLNLNLYLNFRSL